MSKNQNKQAIFGGFRNQVGLQFFAGKNRMTEIEERLAAIRTEMDAEGADLDALSAETDSLIEERKTLLGQAEQRRNLLNKIANGAGGEVRTFQPQPTPPEQREYDRSSEEYRSAWLKTLANNELTETEQMHGLPQRLPPVRWCRPRPRTPSSRRCTSTHRCWTR